MDRRKRAPRLGSGRDQANLGIKQTLAPSETSERRSHGWGSPSVRDCAVVAEPTEPTGEATCGEASGTKAKARRFEHFQKIGSWRKGEACGTDSRAGVPVEH
uniref:(northern house mosquito) hypothetical protein n=1 Tax=Culex pipiens TaxID=7175 RepID=A0A8D8DS10_CULPI